MRQYAITLLCLTVLVIVGCAPYHRPSTTLREDAKDGAPVQAVAGKHMAAQRRGPATKPQPFFNARTQVAEYAGPGREVTPPDNLEEVRIGWFAPDDPEHPTAGMMWQAATLAVEEANHAGGYDGLPFRLVTSWSENPWGSGIKNVTRLVYDEKVWAIAGAPDGPSAHLVEQIVAKARLTFISPVSTDKTTNLANVPWIFSCAPGDHLLAPVLAEALVSQCRGASFAVVSCTDHDSRMFTTELLAALKKLNAFPALHVEFRPGAVKRQSPKSKVQRPKSRETLDFGLWTLDVGLPSLRQSNPAVVALIAGPRDAASFLIALRRDGCVAPVFGGPAMARRLFVETAGEFADGVVFPLLWERSEAFGWRFQDRFGVEPDYTAAYTYDAMNLLIDAIHVAGLNRVRIRDAVRELSPWLGVTETITWGPTGHNHRPARLGTIRNGQVRPRTDGSTNADP